MYPYNQRSQDHVIVHVSIQSTLTRPGHHALTGAGAGVAAAGAAGGPGALVSTVSGGRVVAVTRAVLRPSGTRHAAGAPGAPGAPVAVH